MSNENKVDENNVEDPEHPDPHLETVFATSEADLIPVIKSLLDSSGLEYMTDGESMMNLFPSDLLGPALHRPRGEMRFMVPRDKAAIAREILSEHPDVPFPPGSGLDEGDGDGDGDE